MNITEMLANMRQPDGAYNMLNAQLGIAAQLSAATTAQSSRPSRNYAQGTTAAKKMNNHVFKTRWSKRARLMSRLDLVRKCKWFWQRRTRGFDDRELWNLDWTIAAFIVPRLKRFKEINHGNPDRLRTQDEWNRRLDDMIWAFEQHAEEHVNNPNQFEVANQKRTARGLKLFARWFSALWD